MDGRTSLLRDLFAAAVAAAAPACVLPRHLPARPRGRTIVIGAGKASAAMARAFEQTWDGPLTGLVVTRYGHAVACDRIEIVEAAHPVPDEAGFAAATRMLDAVSGLTGDDLVVALMSGGGSSLLPLPLRPLTLADERDLNAALLASGAPIGEMNVVRRHLSAIKGGRLGAACHPATLVTLAISDVPGDGPGDIASGPTIADPTTCADALAVLDRYRVAIGPKLRDLLASGRGESVKPGDPRLARSDFQLVASPRLALEAAARAAAAAGVPAHIVGDALEGEAREVGRVMAGIALSCARHGTPFQAPCILLSGGETTVTLRGPSRGRGGRNVEFLLALALALDGEPGIHALAADTDGIDGVDEIAGATCGPDSLARARSLGIDPRAALDGHDGHGFFGALGDGVVTGPTLTNVNDFRVILIDGPTN